MMTVRRIFPNKWRLTRRGAPDTFAAEKFRQDEKKIMVDSGGGAVGISGAESRHHLFIKRRDTNGQCCGAQRDTADARGGNAAVGDFGETVGRHHVEH